MTQSNHWRRRVTLLIVTLVVSMVLPAAPTANAAIVAWKTLAESNADYQLGKFGLTGLVQGGGVQLLPLGSLQNVRTGLPPLCKPLSEFGSAAFPTTTMINGQNTQTTYLYVFGGATTNNTTVQSTCHTRIIPSSNPDQPLTTDPWVQDAATLPEPLRANKGIAVTGLVNSSPVAYLYSFGGIDPSGQNLSTDKIYRAQINLDGSVASWQTLEPLRMPDNIGRHAFGLTSFEADDGSTYIYLFGGISRYQPGGFGSVVTIYNWDAWRIKVLPSGQLDATWTKLADIPVRPGTLTASCTGLSETQAATFPVYQSSGQTTTTKQTLFLVGGVYGEENAGIGGCNGETKVTSDVYRATLDSVTGALTWDSNATTGDNMYTLTTPLRGHPAVGYNQKIYVLGGWDANNTPVAGPTRRVFSGYADETQDLVQVSTEPSANFFASGEVLEFPLFTHNAELALFQGQPVIFIMGGRKDETDAGVLDKVYFSIPALDERGSEGYPNNGIYLSPITDMESSIKPLQFRWTGDLTSASTDIEFAYRISESRTGFNSLPWTVLDAVPGDATRTSAVGASSVNTVGISGVQGRFVQYRAILKTTNKTLTPILKKVEMQLEFTAFPNLLPTNLTLVSTTSGFSAQIANQPVPETAEVIDANAPGSGSFFVDLYLFAPGTTVVSPTLDSNGVPDKQGEVFAEVSKDRLDARTTHLIQTGDWMAASCTDGSPTPAECPVNWSSLLNKPGIWNIIMVVDSYGNVVAEAETLAGAWEQDNMRRFTINIGGGSACPGCIYLPTIRR